jgi:iron-sulfur cluster assembly protein CyaY
MDEAEYETLSEKTLRTIGDAFADVDPDVVDCESAGDVVTLLLGGTRKCVVNTQRPTRQIWLAANARAWHFSWDVDSRKWLDDKGRGELFATLASLVREATGVEVPIG